MSLRYVTMPKWGIEMQKGTLAEWHVKEGETVEKGQLIALVETDKITNELEASQDGKVHKLVVSEGEEHIVGQLLAIVGDASESEDAVDAFLSAFVAADTSMAATSGAGTGSSKIEEASKPSPSETPKASAEDYDGLNISPAAKTLAIELSVDPTGLVGTGRKGRISLQDVEQAATAAGLMDSKADETEGGVSANSPQIVEMTTLQKTAAKRLSEAKSTIPHFYLRIDVGLDPLLKRKDDLATSGVKVSLNDLLIKAVANTLKDSPDVNVQLHGDNIHKFVHADIAVAVATDFGLVTPVVKMADTLDLKTISQRVRKLADKARNKKLTRDDLSTGTFTISNLGMFGIDQFDAIINPPQCAILAVGASRREWMESDAGGAFETRMSLSLSCDHRAIDGATGAQFLKGLKANIETPDTLI